jgi:hypothetical protein
MKHLRIAGNRLKFQPIISLIHEQRVASSLSCSVKAHVQFLLPVYKTRVNMSAADISFTLHAQAKRLSTYKHSTCRQAIALPQLVGWTCWAMLIFVNNEAIDTSDRIVSDTMVQPVLPCSQVSVKFKALTRETQISACS